MKIKSFVLIIILAAASCTHCLAQPGGAVAQSRTENAAMLRQTISRPITHLKVLHSSAVNLIYDTANYIDVWYNPRQGNPLDDNFIVIKGMTLVIDDPEGDAVYYVHLKEHDLQSVYRDMEAQIEYRFNADSTFATTAETTDDQDTSTEQKTSTSDLALSKALDEARRELEKAKSASAETIVAGDIITETVEAVEDSEAQEFDESLPIETVVVDEEPGDDYATQHYYRYDDKERSFSTSDRIGFGLLWGFNNWGNEWYNGLSSLDGASELKTSFSSWQLELQYAVVMTRHLNLSLGIGYESDIYRFTTPLVSVDANGRFQDVTSTLPYQNYDDFLQDNQLFASTQLNDWSSRLVTRYIGLPVTLGLRFEEFKISLTALPALALNTRHTGLKHRLKNDSIKYRDNEDISSFITPYKLDLRVEVRYSVFGIFAQVATTSLFSGSGNEVFPLKIGFEIKK